MADGVDTIGSDSAEKAYAAAAENALAKAKAEAAAREAPAPLAFPAKPKRADVVASAPKVAPKVANADTVATPAELVMPARSRAAKQPAKVAKPAATAKLAASAKKAATARPLKSGARKVEPVAPVVKTNPINSLKELIMATKQTEDFTATVKNAAADLQGKAKQAFAKSSEVLGEVSEFTKGNVEALVASGKILGAGLQELGKTYAEESKTAYETVTADLKQLAEVKSPVDFVRIQTSILRRNIDRAFDIGGKRSEAVLKLAGETIAPISARASMAVEKLKKAA